MIAKNCEGRVPPCGALTEADQAMLALADAALGKAREAMTDFALHVVLSEIWAVVAEANRYFAGNEPWRLSKTDPERRDTVLYVTAEVLRQVAILVQPVMPSSMAKLLDLLGVPAEKRDFAALGEGGRLTSGTALPARAASSRAMSSPKAARPPDADRHALSSRFPGFRRRARGLCRPGRGGGRRPHGDDLDPGRALSTYAAIAERFSSVWCSVGTHPHGAHEELDVTAEQLVALSAHPRCVAIGEAGLDYHYDKSPREAQAQGLRVHIAAARITQLPLVIHARQADDDMIAILREEMGKGAFPAILHCFTAGEALAMTGVELGLYVSFSGILTFKTSEELRRIARMVPRDRLLVETDAPYLAPVPFRGKRNEPAYVVETAKVLGDVLGLSFPEVAALTTANARRCYWKMDHAAPLAQVA